MFERYFHFSLACSSRILYIIAFGMRFDQALEQEVSVLDALRFHLRVYHPHRSLNDFLAQLQVYTSC
jgi:hypothetical protein